MLPVWPFNRRSIRHRTFGRLRPTRKGKFWRTRMAMPHAGRDVEVHINGEQGPTDAQEKLYLQIAQHYPKVMKAALGALHREYQRVTVAQPQLKWPLAEAPQDLLRLVPLNGIWLDDGHGHKFVLSFQHEHDKEQEFHVFFKNWKLESVTAER